MHRWFKKLIDPVRLIREERHSAQNDYRHYKVILSTPPTHAEECLIDDSGILIACFNGEINSNEAGNQLTKGVRFLLYIPLIMIEAGIVTLAFFAFRGIMLNQWPLALAICVMAILSFPIGWAFQNFIYEPVGRFALKRRISRLEFWSTVACGQVTTTNKH